MADKSQVEELFGSDSEEEPDASSGAAASSAAPTGFEPEEEQGGDVDEADLFGSDDDDEGGGSAPRRTQDQPSAPPLHYELPVLPKPNPDAELLVMRTPNILSINPRPFVMEEFEDEHEEGRQAQTDNVIRWRENPETGAPESNARIVTWSDGSMTLHVGGEVLSAMTHKLEGGDQLFSRIKGSNMECHGVLRKKMVLQPVSTGSSTHHKLTQAIAKQYVGKQRTVKHISTTADPEKKKLEDEKVWNEKQRMMMRQNARGSQEEYGADGGGDGRAFDAAFLDDDDDVGEGNLGAIKDRFKRGGKKKAGGQQGRRPPPGRAAFGGKRPRSGLASGRRRARDSDDDDEDDDDDEEDGEEEDTGEMQDFIVGDEDEAEESGDDDEDEADDDDDDDDDDDEEEDFKPKKKRGRK